MGTLCLACENVAFSYENQIVVSDLDFSVEEGDYLCIIWANGTGKSTLMKGMLGLKKPAAGKIVLGEHIRPGQIGYVPQQTPAQRDFPALVGEVVLSGCLSKGMGRGSRKEKKRLAQEKLELLGIAQLWAKSFRELSGGQRQRVLLARALCAAQRLILLDEPTTGLDAEAAEEFYHLLLHLNREHNITVVMVSHALREAFAHADHILCLSHNGYFFGRTEEYLESEEGRHFYGRCRT